MKEPQPASRSERGRTFPICKDHVHAGWNEPSLAADMDCILCHLFYLEAQESLLEEWQQRAKRAEEAIKEMERPLDAQMARLNATVERLNGELATARSAKGFSPNDGTAHIDHPLRHFDRTCLACWQETEAPVSTTGALTWRAFDNYTEACKTLGKDGCRVNDVAFGYYMMRDGSVVAGHFPLKPEAPVSATGKRSDG